MQSEVERVSIQIAESSTDIQRCFFVMHQLRPHLNEDIFVAQVQRQVEQGYILASNSFNRDNCKSLRSIFTTETQRHRAAQRANCRCL